MSRHGSRAWRSGEVGSGGLVTAVAGLALSLGSVGCELQEITLAESQDLVVAEVFVQIGQGANRITAFLHRTEDGNRGGGAEVPGAGVQLLVGPGIAAMDLLETDVDQCLVPTEDPADRVPGTCYAASPLDELLVSDGDSIRVVIDLPDGGQLWGETVVPEGFDIVSPSNSVCTLGAGQTLEIQWTASAGTWAYVSETVISGLRDVLEPEGIVVEEDPLDLVGLSISASDTTIVFPTEFGVFERLGGRRGRGRGPQLRELGPRRRLQPLGSGSHPEPAGRRHRRAGLPRAPHDPHGHASGGLGSSLQRIAGRSARGGDTAGGTALNPLGRVGGATRPRRASTSGVS
jgi:hypothetical protein